MWKKYILAFSLLFVFGITGLNCVAAEDERNPLLGSNTYQQPRPINYQPQGQWNPGVQQGPYQQPMPQPSGWAPTPGVVDEGEMLYQQGMHFLGEAQRLEAMNNAVGSIGTEVNYRIDWGAYNKARKNAFSFFNEASARGHVGAMIRIKEETLKGTLDEIQKISFCCSESGEKCFSTTCCVISACFPALCPIWLATRTVMLLNLTSDEQISETHNSFDREMKELSELESRTQHPIFKHEISQLKNNVLRVRAEYDHRVSLRFNSERCYMSCCNCKIRDLSGNNTVQ